jgi:hypothetical protein
VTHYVVDASNVIGSRPDGWWRDRRAAEDRLIEAVGRLAAADDEVYTVVLDRTGADRSERNVTVRHAVRRGRNAADDVIVAVVAAAQKPEEIVVVTGDRELRSRVEDLGARGTGPRGFRDQLDL